MTETTILFGPDDHLVGTFTAPPAGVPARNDVLLLLTNAGVIPRIGPHRLNVRIARHFAQRGIPSLRFDTSGLGDSERSTGTASVNAQFVADTRAAMDAAERQFGRRNFIMMGFCSGGDIAYMTALEDARLKAISLFDSYVYPTRKTQLFSLRHRLRTAGAVGLVRKLAQRIGRRFAAHADTSPSEPAPPRTIFGRANVPPKHEFAAKIDRLVERDVKIMFAYSGGEPNAYNYARQFHETFAGHAFVDQVHYAYLDRCDHVLTQPHAQRAFLEVADRWLSDLVLDR